MHIDNVGFGSTTIVTINLGLCTGTAGNLKARFENMAKAEEEVSIVPFLRANLREWKL